MTKRLRPSLALAILLAMGTAHAQTTPPSAEPTPPTEAERRMLCLVARDQLDEARRVTASIKGEIENDPEPSIDKLLVMLIAVRLEIAKTETFEARCRAQ